MTDSHQYLDNDSTNRRKSVKQMSRNLHGETAKTCMATQNQSPKSIKVQYLLRCDYCGRFTKESDLTDYWVRENYWICNRCKEKRT